ncbi:MAG TPA: class I SAM-dependent methyltransferase, partial [Pirellulales bacterium]|nr:class I SAM-dependent methyltransferase [Pirellulales bacterium]
MFTTDQYQLLDFGRGRKLERFGAYLLDRPAPAAELAERRDAAAWQQAAARYERAGRGGQWNFHGKLAPTWIIRSSCSAFNLKFSRFGQVGLFPEQTASWSFIGQQVRAAGRPIKVLNLFAYTGGSTLVAAAMGALVTHVDAASSVVSWARQNALASGLANAPIRWITDDVLKFARRELKRGEQYDAVVLDPPSYGHGPHGERWKLEDQLGELLDVCLKLMSRESQFLLLTCHS